MASSGSLPKYAAPMAPAEPARNRRRLMYIRLVIGIPFFLFAMSLFS